MPTDDEYVGASPPVLEYQASVTVWAHHVYALLGACKVQVQDEVEGVEREELGRKAYVGGPLGELICND
jgi:hypothetical protein